MTSSVAFESAQDCDPVWVLRDRVRFRGALDGTTIEMLEIEVSPGSGITLHQHASPEMIRILSGEITFTTIKDGLPESVLARAGDVLRIPAFAPHGFVNASGAPAKLLLILEATLAEYFRDVGRRTPSFGPLTPEEWEEVASASRKHGITFLEHELAGPEIL